MIQGWLEPPLDSVQWELQLFPGVPWGGISPRELTRARMSLFLRREPPPHEVPVADPRQLELFPVKRRFRKKGPPLVYRGAPLL